jgi:hypothetical protein
MAYRRAQMHRLQELVRLHRFKTGARETARPLGMGPNTERQYREALVGAGLLDGPPETLPSLEELRAAVESARPPARPPAAAQLARALPTPDCHADRQGVGTSSHLGSTALGAFGVRWNALVDQATVSRHPALARGAAAGRRDPGRGGARRDRTALATRSARAGP